LLFWLSLLPFATGWMGENHFAPVPTAAYGFVLLAVGCWNCVLALAANNYAAQGESSVLRRAVGKDWKGKLSPVLYLLAIVLTFFAAWAAQLIFVLVAFLWLIPDRRIEHALKNDV
jgi:uncharacterized membrane protein